MVCYLVRHGKDEETVRGGWSDHSLVPEGIAQVKALGEEIAGRDLRVEQIYSSDLRRAKETALILKEYLHCPITYVPEFREANNGYLAGMKHELADEQYPGVYWNTLAYDECYPGGESPEQFFRRIRWAWAMFKEKIAHHRDAVLLVTHGGVLETILCIENGVEFSNKVKHFKTPGAALFPVDIQK